MNINKHILAVAVSLAIAATLQAADSGYSIVDLGTLGGISSSPYGINNLGQVVGVADTVSGYSHAVLFDSTGGGANQDLGTLPGAVRSHASAINDLGQIVGDSEVHTPGSYSVYQATLFSGTGTNNTYLGNLNGNDTAFDSTATAINNSGQIIGNAKTGVYNNGDGNNGIFHPVYFSNTGNIDLDPTAANDITSNADAINDAGKIVGESGGKAALFNVASSGIVNRVDISTGRASVVSAINNSDEIVGYSIIANIGNGASEQNGTKFSPNGDSVTSIGGTNVIALNNNGDFIWTSASGSFITVVRNGVTQRIDNTLYGAGFEFYNINGGKVMNDWGQIVANGTKLTSAGTIPHAILLNPTTPVSSQTGNTQETKFVSGMSYTKFTSQVSADGFGTTVNFLDGVASANRAVTTTTNATPQVGLVSDTVTVSGTFNDTVVLQLSYDAAQAVFLYGSESEVRLVWRDPSDGQWKNAVDGNTGGTAFFAGDGAYNSATDFNLGTYGIDTTNNTVWAVIDHNSNFGVSAVPEPGTYAFAIMGLLLCGGAVRHRKVSV